MSKEEIIAKVQKLMALGESPNPHEAELAKQKAAELLALHDMSMMDVIAKKKKDGTIMDIVNKALFDEYVEGNYTWEGMVLVTLCGVFECSTVRSYAEYSLKRQFVVFGTEQDLEMIAHFFRYLRMRIMNKQRSEKMNKKQSYFYASGVMTTINTRLRDMYKRKEEILKSNVETKDLVIFKKDLAEKAMNEAFPNRKQRKGPQKVDRHAFNVGMNDGQKIPISRPIDHNGQPMRHIN